MFELLDGYPDSVVAVRGTGRVTAEDYRTVLDPSISRATADGRTARILL
jgi:hypothetical protein